MQIISRGRLFSLALLCGVICTAFTVGAVGYSAPEVKMVSAPVVTPVAQPVMAGIPRNVKTPAPVLMAQAARPLAPPVRDANAAQSSSPQSLSGQVFDPTGAVVPNAVVALSGADKTTTMYSDPVGKFVFQNIDPGTYTVSIKAAGFKALSQTNVVVAPNEAHNVGSMNLMIGSMSESVSVVGSRAGVQAAPVGNIGGQPTNLGPATTLDQKAPAGTFSPRAATVAEKPRADQAGPSGSSPRPQRVGGMVQAAKLLTPVVKPVYPVEARETGVQGTVQFEAVVTKEGTIGSLKLISGPPALVQGALDAVKQWTYSPTLLNGEPIEVMTTIDVHFTISD